MSAPIGDGVECTHPNPQQMCLVIARFPLEDPSGEGMTSVVPSHGAREA